MRCCRDQRNKRQYRENELQVPHFMLPSYGTDDIQAVIEQSMFAETVCSISDEFPDGRIGQLAFRRPSIKGTFVSVSREGNCGQVSFACP
jgi:hypothetical protein